MKELYQCEKCGAIFNTWAEAQDHEDHGHAYIPRYGLYDSEAVKAYDEGKEDNDMFSQTSSVAVINHEYKEGYPAPVNITLGLERWVPVDKDSDGNDHYAPRIMLYRYKLATAKDTK